MVEKKGAKMDVDAAQVDVKVEMSKIFYVDPEIYDCVARNPLAGWNGVTPKRRCRERC